MRLRWYGQSAFLLTANEGTVMIDPLGDGAALAVLRHIERQLELVRARRRDLDALERDLVERRKRVCGRLEEVQEEIRT